MSPSGTSCWLFSFYTIHTYQMLIAKRRDLLRYLSGAMLIHKEPLWQSSAVLDPHPESEQKSAAAVTVTLPVLSRSWRLQCRLIGTCTC